MLLQRSQFPDMHGKLLPLQATHQSCRQTTRVAEQTLNVKSLNSGGGGTLLCKRKASSPSISHSLFCLWNWSCCLAKCSHSALQRVYTRKSYNKLMDLVTPGGKAAEVGNGYETSYKTMKRLSNHRSQRRLLWNIPLFSCESSSSAEFGGRPISFALGICADEGVGGLGSRLEMLLWDEVGSTPFVVGEFASTGLPFSIRYSYHQSLRM
jgi:hypothetical protein